MSPPWQCSTATANAEVRRCVSGTALEQSAAEGAAAVAAADLRTLLAASGPAALEGLTLPLLSAAPALIPGQPPALQLLMAVADAGALTRMAGAVSLGRLSCCFAPRVMRSFAAECASMGGRSGGGPDMEAEAGGSGEPKGGCSNHAGGIGSGAKRRRAGSWEDSDFGDEEEEGGNGRAAGKGGAAKRGAAARRRSQARSTRSRRSRRPTVSDSDEEDGSGSDAGGSSGAEGEEEEEDEQEDGEPRQARGRAAGTARRRPKPPKEPSKERSPQPAGRAPDAVRAAAAAAADLAAAAAGWDAGTRRALYHVLAAEALAAGPGFARAAATGLLGYLSDMRSAGYPAEGAPGRGPRRLSRPGVDAEAAVGAGALLRGIPPDPALLRQLLALPAGHRALAAAALAAWRAQGACSGGANAAGAGNGGRGGKARGRGGGRAGARGDRVGARKGLQARVAAALQAAAALAERGGDASDCACLRELWGLDSESDSDV